MYVDCYKQCVASETYGSVEEAGPYLFLYLFVRNIGNTDANSLGVSQRGFLNQFQTISGSKISPVQFFPI